MKYCECGSPRLAGRQACAQCCQIDGDVGQGHPRSATSSVVALLRDNGRMTIRQICEARESTYNATHVLILRLVRRGVVRVVPLHYERCEPRLYTLSSKPPAPRVNLRNSKARRHVLDLMQLHGWVTVQDVADELGCMYESAYHLLRRMWLKQLVQGKLTGARRKMYALPEVTQ